MSIRFGRSGNGYDSSEVMETEDDDWRKVTDLNERRKIQNRLAQRNYRRKLRQRLEELERQAGAVSTTTTSTVSPLKKKRRQSSAEASSTSSRAEKRSGRGHPARATKISSLDDRNSSREAMVSGASTEYTRATSAPRNLYTIGEFGPLFASSDDRQQGTRQPLTVWNPQPYSQQQQPYEQHLAQPYYQASPPPVFSMAPQSQTVSEPLTSPPQIQAYISSLQTDSPLPVSSLTHAFSRGEDSSPITHTSYQPNAPQSITIDNAPVGIPDLPPAYSASLTTNPNTFQPDAPLQRGDSDLTLNYSMLFNATIEIAKILQVSEQAMNNEDTIPPFNRPTAASLSEGMEDLRPTKKQSEIINHPYINIVPFKGLKDRFLGYSVKGEETGDYIDEAKLSCGMYEGWGTWGQIPWEAKGWEMGEAFAR